MNAIWVEITATRGSTPRDAGTAMKVTAGRTEGTIGGGALEHKAIATARQMLRNGEVAHRETLPLGPNLGQCCGGAVSLRYTDAPRVTDLPLPAPMGLADRPDHPVPLWLWGAGHVGRACVALCDRKEFDITWVDSAAERFPDDVAPEISVMPTRDMPRLASHAPSGAHHLIFTYSHDIDLALCAALLRGEAASIGLIGSDTKWARFSKRLRAMGLDPAPITCPIGDKSLGKAPAQIAQGTLQSLLQRIPAKAFA